MYYVIAILICKTSINEEHKITKKKKSCVKYTDPPLEYINIKGQLIIYRNICVCVCVYIYIYIYIYIYTHISVRHNEVSVNDGPHIRRWSHKILTLYYKAYHYVTISYSSQYSNIL